jgi:hypothetical protein
LDAIREIRISGLTHHDTVANEHVAGDSHEPRVVAPHGIQRGRCRIVNRYAARCIEGKRR